MENNNVIQFPKSPKNPSITIEEVQQNMDVAKMFHIQEALELVAPNLFNQLEMAGFNLSENLEEHTYTKDGVFIVEAIRSLLSKYYGIYHPFQLISENVLNQDEQDESILKIAEQINLNLEELKSKID